MSSFTESLVEDATLTWLERPGYQVLCDAAIALADPAAEGKERVQTAVRR
jgi:hypothetical protein